MPGERFRMLVGAVLKNKGIKFVALGLALLAWYTIREAISNEREISEIPIEITIAQGWAVHDRSEKVATVTFKGPNDALFDLERDQIRVSLTIEGEPQRDTVVAKIEPKHVQSMGGVRVMKVEPDSILLHVDREGSSEIKVVPNLQGQLPNGYALGNVVCNPETITLYGPQKRLAATESISTESIDLAGRLNSTQLTRSILPPSESWVARVEPDEISVGLEIIEISSDRVFSNLPVHVLVAPGKAPGFSLADARVNVVLKGRADILEALDDAAVQAYVSALDLGQTPTNRVPVEVNIPNGTVLKKIEPSTIVVVRDSVDIGDAS